LEAAVDRVRDRFGSEAIAPARLGGRRAGRGSACQNQEEARPGR